MAASPTQTPTPLPNLRRLLIRPHEDVRLATWVWGAFAIASILAGLLTAGDTGRSEAYFDVRHWLEVWRAGANVYELPLAVDYPPQALVFMSPLLWFPISSGQVLFAVVNAVAAVGASWYLVSLMSGYAGVQLTRAERLCYVLMLVAWSPTRVCIWNGQTTLLLILCCSLALCWAERYPIIAGLALGIGMSKPHIALGFLIFAAFLRQWRLIATAIGTALAAALAYTYSVGRSPFVVLSEYTDTLLNVYGGPRFLRGEVDMRPFFVDLIRDYALGESVFLFTAAALGVLLIVLTVRVRNNRHAATLVLAASATLAISVFPFRRYGLHLLAPAVLVMLWRPGNSQRMLTWLSLANFAIAADVPFLIRHAMITYGSKMTAEYAQLTHYGNRIIIVACLIMTFTELARADRRAAT